MHHPAVPSTEKVLTCPLCGSGRSKLLFTSVDRFFRLPGEFGVTQCIDCELVRLSPRPVIKQISYYYPESTYYSYQSPGEVGGGRWGRLRDFIRNSVLESLGYSVGPLSWAQRVLQPFFVKLLSKPSLYGYGQQFPSFVPNGRAMDIGCGNGSYLHLLKKHGWSVYGVDFSEKAAAVAKEKFDIDVFVGNVEDAPFEDGSFDFIILSHSIEHLPDPLAAIKRVHRLLKPTGRVFIETPNIESFSARLFKEYWMPLEAPRHLYLFSQRTLSQLLSSAGLRVLRMRTKLFTQTFIWADTYKQEDALGRKLEKRPSVRSIAAPRAYLLMGLAWLGKAINNNAEFIQCWAGSRVDDGKIE